MGSSPIISSTQNPLEFQGVLLSRKSVCGHFFVWRTREFLPVRIRSRSAEIRGNVLSKAKTRGSAQVAASDCNRRALPSEPSRELVL